MQKAKATRFSSITLCLLLSVVFSACIGGGSQEPSRYYTLAVENTDMPKGSPSEKRILVRKFTIDQAYQRNNIVYRESAYDFSFYDFDLWASRPEQMIMQISAEYLSKSGIFSSVETKNAGKPDFELSGNITAIEEVDENDSQYARLAMEISLRKVDSDSAIFNKRFDEKMPIEKREARHVAESISKLLAKIMADVLEEIASNSL